VQLATWYIALTRRQKNSPSRVCPHYSVIKNNYLPTCLEIAFLFFIYTSLEARNVDFGSHFLEYNAWCTYIYLSIMINAF
jgi:hypothetical protein